MQMHFKVKPRNNIINKHLNNARSKALTTNNKLNNDLHNTIDQKAAGYLETEHQSKDGTRNMYFIEAQSKTNQNAKINKTTNIQQM